LACALVDFTVATNELSESSLVGPLFLPNRFRAGSPVTVERWNRS
jgi:hypothetical protein